MPVIQTSRLPSSSSGSLHNAEQRLLPSLHFNQDLRQSYIRT
jgi:hypothetical protein